MPTIVKKVSQADRKKFWKERPIVFKKYNGRCAYCGCHLTDENYAIDHIIPVYEYVISRVKLTNPDFDVNALANLNPSCVLCNSHKAYYTIEQFRKNIKDGAERLRLRNNSFVLVERYGGISLVENFEVVFYYETLKK